VSSKLPAVPARWLGEVACKSSPGFGLTIGRFSKAVASAKPRSKAENEACTMEVRNLPVEDLELVTAVASQN